MGNQKVLLLVLAVLGVGVIGFFTLSGNKQIPSQTQPTVTEGKTEVTSAATNGFSKRFIVYSDENLKKASENGRAVVFFHASWCPLCSEAEADLKSNWEKVPQDITILKTDYDSSKQLKTKYGVVSQDTWVQVDGSGRELTKWNSGGRGFASLLANVR